MHRHLDPFEAYSSSVTDKVFVVSRRKKSSEGPSVGRVDNPL